MSFNFFKNYLNFSIEIKHHSKFEKYFINKSKNVHIDESINLGIYNKLKIFFLDFNYDSQTKTFSENIYKNYEFSYLRIITIEDLMWIKFLNENSNTTEISVIENLYKDNVLSNCIMNRDEILYKPVDWKFFVSSIKDINNFENLDYLLHHLENKITNRRFNFKHYQKLHKILKENVLLNTLKYGLIITKKDPDHQIIREYN